MPFQYKKIVVIGATSEALADRFVAEGSFVIAVGRRKERLEALVHRHGKNSVQAVPFDITQIASIPHFVTNLINTHEDLDCVVFNSGVQKPCDFSDLSTVDMDTITLEWTTNYMAYLALTKAFLPFFQTRNFDSALVYVTSNLALIPIPGVINYCATKAALHHFILALRVQLRSTRIKVVEIYPPAVQTELHDYLPDGRSVGMPLDQFTNEAYAGLSKGMEQIPVGSGKKHFDNHGWEMQRQERFESLFKARNTR